jgi:PKHD-type hydroxylase
MTRQNWLYWHKSIDVDAILKVAEKEVVQDATTFGGMNEQYRRSKVAWLTGNETIMNLLWPYVNAAAGVMGVDVGAVADFQYTEYHGSQEAKYDWHHDVDWSSDSGRDRKLSVTVQLSDPSDYEGGHFEFQEVVQPDSECRDKGTVLIFPSYLQHRVTPVTSGVRKTLVAWFEGPTWR